MTPLLLTLLCAAPPPERLFAELDVALPGRPASAVAVSPVDDRVILASVEGLLFRSNDLGATWDLVLRTSAQTVLPVEEQIEMEDQAEEAAEEIVDNADSDDSATDDVDAEAVVEDTEEDVQETLAADREGSVDTSLPEGDVAVGTEDVRITLPQELPGVRRIRWVSTETVYVATHRGLYRSTDGGQSFLPLGLPKSPRLRDVRDVCVATKVPTLVVAATKGGTLISSDGGITFYEAAGIASMVQALACAIGPGTNPTILVGTVNGLLMSKDRGLVFQDVALNVVGPRMVHSLAVDEESARVYAATRNLLHAGYVGLRALDPTGGPWRDGLTTLFTDVQRPGTLWVGGRYGVFMSTDGGRTATEIGDESMIRDVIGVAVGHKDWKLVLAATAAGLVAYLPVVERPTGPSPKQLLLKLMEQEPTAVETAEWSVEHHRADPNHMAQMRTRTRLAWLGPQLAIQAVAPTPNIRGLTIGSTSSLYSAPPVYGLGFGAGVMGVARWNLDRAIATPTEAAARVEHRRLLKERERVFRRVLRTYEARRRLQIDLMLKAPRNDSAMARKRLQLEELTATLDAQTGGRFTLEARRRGAPGDGISVKIDPVSRER